MDDNPISPILTAQDGWLILDGKHGMMSRLAPQACP